MKKITRIAILLLCLVIVFAFSSCKKSNAQPNSNDGEKSSIIYYDKNGVPYTELEQVKYYDKDGNVYLLSVGEDYMPDYINQSTGEHLNGFDCYIDEDGYFVYDSSASFKLVSGTIDTYTDTDGNTYYQIATVKWNSSGEMLHN